jgi:hypothetical protein
MNHKKLTQLEVESIFPELKGSAMKALLSGVENFCDNEFSDKD